jgi:NADH:ubiquinone oxidoreductase subunit F (NADH-binding)/Pyruvate/2-oxoacid:ferredoxin oxidoreductase delta subunit
VFDEPKCHDNNLCTKRNADYKSEILHLNNTKPVIFLGTGTCGLGAGAAKTLEKIKSYLIDNSIDADIVQVGCIGLCSFEPIVEVKLPKMNRISFGHATADKISGILDGILHKKINNEHVLYQFRNEGNKEWEGIDYIEEHPFFKNQVRWVLDNCGIIDPVSIKEYLAKGGFKALCKALINHSSIDICDIIEKSGLRGRGGGGFLSGKKWKLANAVNSTQKYLICNADEGDPGAFMDRAVIEGDPFKLIEGITIASYGIGASKAYVYIRAEYPLAIANLRSAISQSIEYGLLGENILDSGHNLEIIIKMGAGAFVCGEETALIHSIEGKRGMPKPRPPFPAVSGLFGKPTVINNVETLANIPGIIANGAEWFNAIGTEMSKGTKVFALSGNIRNTGLVEVKMGTTLREIVYDIGNGIPDDKKFKAVQIGGPSGGCIPESHIDIDVDYESLKKVGAMMGSGGLVVMDENTCMVDVAKFFMDFIQRESCGKCIPCREGTRRILEILDRITSKPEKGQSKSELQRIQSVITMKSLAEVIQETSLCGLGKSAPNPVLSTLRWFKDEYEEHIYIKKCSSKVCRDLLTYTIIQENCTGCTICAKKCPSDAILGALKKEHYIVMDKCIACGSCVEVCRFNAISVN